MLPTEGLKDAAIEYARMVGLDTNKEDEGDLGFSNASLVNFNWGLLQKNNCFRELVSEFYTKVAAYSAFHSRKFKLSESPLFNNLAVSTNKESEGWLWKLAFDMSNNNSNLALSLIGICGHDNTAQLPGSKICSKERDGQGNLISTKCKDDSQFIPFVSEKQREKYLIYADEFYNNFRNNWKPKTKSKMTEPANLKRELVGDESKGLACPKFASPMFIQGALGAQTLLDPAFISEIAAIQAPNKGAEFLPSKYYHVIGAAATVCSLVRNGIPGFIAKRIQTTAINTYRMVNVCEFVESRLESEKYVHSTPEDDIIKKVLAVRKEPKLCIPDYDSTEEFHSFQFHLPECRIVAVLQDMLFDKEVDEAILRNKVSRMASEIDASTIFKKYVTQGSDCKRVQYTGGAIHRLKSVSDSARYVRYCGTLPAARCQAARDVLRTWWIDFMWSEAQHIKGAEFAIDHCEEEHNFLGSGLEKKSCQALAVRK
ncbi:MAG: hypothetical protein IPJ71_19320 [Bdellovibrionales bacterium]|nr:hypothetical protein [Bdellovibrionales bacterium]